MASPGDVLMSRIMAFCLQVSLLSSVPTGRSDFIIDFSQFSERDVMRVSGNRYTFSRASVDSDLLFLTCMYAAF